MSWRLRRSAGFGPLRFTLTNRGITPSIGAPGLRFSASPDGKIRRTLRIPGFGLYNTEQIGTWRRRRPRA